MGRRLASSFVLLASFAIAPPAPAQTTPPDEPAFLSSSLWCGANGVRMVGSTAYVTYWSGLAVLDVADRSAPRLLGKSGDVGWCSGIAVSGGLAYLAQGLDGMRIVDVSDPTAPVEIARYASVGEISQVIVRGSYAYLSGWDWGGLEIVDVSDPEAPVRVGYCGVGGRISIEGNTLYAASGHDGVAVVDVSDPRLPHLVAQWPVGFITDVEVANGRVYAVWISGEVPRPDPSGILIYDATDPLEPVYLGEYDSGEEWVRSVNVVGTTCYVPSEGKILLLDVADPSAPFLIERLQTGGDPSCIDVSGGFAAIADGWGGLRMADVHDPTQPALLGTYVEANATSDVAFGERVAYVADAVSGIHVVDVRDPIHPVVLGRAPLKGGADVIAAAEPYVVTLSMDGWIDVVDATDPAAPARVGHLDLGDALRDFALVRTRAYAVNTHRFNSIDLSDPGNPVVVGTCPLPDWAWQIRVHGNFAYVGNGYSGLRVVDISDPTQPVVRGALDIYEWVYDLETDGTHVYANLDNNRLGVFDVSDPEHPAQILNMQMPGFLQEMRLVGDRLFCAASPGVVVLDVSNPAAPVTVGTARTRGTSLDVHATLVGLAGGGSFEILGPEAAGIFEAPRASAGITLVFANPLRGGAARVLVALDAAQPVRVTVHDVLGRAVATLCDRRLAAGPSTLVWDARIVPAGVYFVRADGARGSVSRAALIVE